MDFVSSKSRTPTAVGRLFALETGTKAFLGAMEQDPQVAPVNAIFLADFVFVFFFQEDSGKEVAVSLVHVRQDFADLFPGLFGNQGRSRSTSLSGSSR